MCREEGCNQTPHPKSPFCSKHRYRHYVSMNPTAQSTFVLTYWLPVRDFDWCKECQTGTLHLDMVPRNKYQAGREFICTVCRNWFGHDRNHQKVTPQLRNTLYNNSVEIDKLSLRHGLYSYTAEGDLEWEDITISALG